MNAQEIESAHVQAVIDALRKASVNIKRHDGVRTREKQQVQEAFELVSAPSESASSKQMRRKHSYQRFLKKVQEMTSLRMVVLCAVGLGKSRVASMRDGVRLSLPLQIRGHEASLDCEVLQSIVDGISVESTLLLASLVCLSYVEKQRTLKRHCLILHLVLMLLSTQVERDPSTTRHHKANSI